MRTRSGEPYATVDDACFVLSPHLPGMAYTDHYASGAVDRARQFGAAIARLHVALSNCDRLVRVPEMDLPGEIARSGQLVRSILPAGQPSIDLILLELEAGLNPHFARLPKQLIHRDAHPGNMLFDDGQLTGWLDFEIMLRGPRLFDLGYCATSLLINGMGDPARRQAWFSLLAALVEGYETITPLAPVERLSLWFVLLSIEMIFIAYFSRQNYAAGVAKNIDALVWLYKHSDELQPYEHV